MVVNATLIVQAIHFGITYYLLTRILLYPAAHILQREDAVQERIAQDIRDLQQKAEDYEVFRKQQWHGCVQALASRKPDSPYIPEHRILDVRIPQVEISEIDTDVRQQIADVIMQRARHD